MAQALSRRRDMSGGVGVMVGLGAGGDLLLRGHVGEPGIVELCCIALAAFVSEERSVSFHGVEETGSGRVCTSGVTFLSMFERYQGTFLVSR